MDHVAALPSEKPPTVDLNEAEPLMEEVSVESLKATLEGVQEELIACQRLAMLGNLAAMAAHEFNNLMAPIVPLAEASLSMDDEGLMRKALTRTLTNAQRAIALTRHMLDLAHNDYQPTDMCSVASAVREAIATTARPFEKDGIELRVTVPEELEVCAREDLLCQVLLNLLLNARQAMKKTRGLLAINAMSVGDCVQIDVRDSGIGIPVESLDNVINPFLAADPKQCPTDWQRVGIGLSVCRMIAFEHGARIEALANEGQGVTFRLLWPKEAAPTE